MRPKFWNAKSKGLAEHKKDARNKRVISRKSGGKKDGLCKIPHTHTKVKKDQVRKKKHYQMVRHSKRVMTF